MVSFDTAMKALVNGTHIRRASWSDGSTMYADQNNQLMRTSPKGSKLATEYGWMLDLNDLAATDWQLAASTSTPHLGQILL